MRFPYFPCIVICIFFQISWPIVPVFAVSDKPNVTKTMNNSGMRNTGPPVETRSETPAQPTTLDTELVDLSTKNQQLSEALKRANEDYQQLKQMSGQAIYLNQTNQKMREELELLKIELEKLTQQNYQLAEDNRVEGIMQGTIAVLIGALLTLFIPRISNRKSFSSWN